MGVVVLERDVIRLSAYGGLRGVGGLSDFLTPLGCNVCRENLGRDIKLHSAKKLFMFFLS